VKPRRNPAPFSGPPRCKGGNGPYFAAFRVFDSDLHRFHTHSRVCVAIGINPGVSIFGSSHGPHVGVESRKGEIFFPRASPGSSFQVLSAPSWLRPGCGFPNRSVLPAFSPSSAANSGKNPRCPIFRKFPFLVAAANFAASATGAICRRFWAQSNGAFNRPFQYPVAGGVLILKNDAPLFVDDDGCAGRPDIQGSDGLLSRVLLIE